MKHILLNRSNVVVDILDTIRYIKLLPERNIVVACPEAEGIGVIGSDANTHYILMKCDVSSNPNAVRVISANEPLDDVYPGYAYLDDETGELVITDENLLETPEQKAIADTDAMVVDQEYRITLLELGLTE